MKKIFFITITLSMFFACKKEEVKPLDNTPKEGKIILKFDNRVGNEELILSNLLYRNAQKDSFNVTKMQYTITDISFVKIDDSEVKIPADSATYAINEADILNTWRKVSGITLGTYKGVKFNLGSNNSNVIFELSGKFNQQAYSHQLTTQLPVNLTFTEPITVREFQDRPSSAHIFADAALIMNGLKKEDFAKVFVVNHVENY